jgi:hypothetical protein
MPKMYEKTLWHEQIDMPTSSETFLIVIRLSFITIFSTFFIDYWRAGFVIFNVFADIRTTPKHLFVFFIADSP